jgi:hypothetical protein
VVFAATLEAMRLGVVAIGFAGTPGSARNQYPASPLSQLGCGWAEALKIDPLCRINCHNFGVAIVATASPRIGRAKSVVEQCQAVDRSVWLIRSGTR